jgi:hypothetical protein
MRDERVRGVRRRVIREHGLAPGKDGDGKDGGDDGGFVLESTTLMQENEGDGVANRVSSNQHTHTCARTHLRAHTLARVSAMSSSSSLTTTTTTTTTSPATLIHILSCSYR